MAVMNTKFSTKAWSDAKQTSGLKSDSAKTMSAGDAQKLLKGEDIGTYLNKLTDPNYVDPAKRRKVGSSELGKDAFMKLMLAQMQNQDPTNPVDSHEMAAQLAQFSSLEQLFNINKTLGGLKKDQNPMVGYQAVNFIGKNISADTTNILREKGDTVHDIRFNLSNNADNIVINIKDKTGQVVKRIEKAGSHKQGENVITWNGDLDTGTVAKTGKFFFDVEATTAGGAKVLAQTSFNGQVTGVNYTSEGPVLMVGDQKVRLSEVKKIEDQELKLAQKKEAEEKRAAQSQAHEQKGAAEKSTQGAEVSYEGNIGSIPMSSGLKNTIAKEKGKNG